MNNTLHIKVSKKPPLVRGKPRLTVISKEVRLRDLSQQSSEVTDSLSAEQAGSPDESGIGMTSTRGRPLLNLRDGPITIRDPIWKADKEGYIPAQTQNYFVRLCDFSVPSVVKMNTTEHQISTGKHKAIVVLNNKDIPQTLHGNKPHAGGEFLNSAMGN